MKLSNCFRSPKLYILLFILMTLSGWDYNAHAKPKIRSKVTFHAPPQFCNKIEVDIINNESANIDIGHDDQIKNNNFGATSQVSMCLNDNACFGLTVSESDAIELKELHEILDGRLICGQFSDEFGCLTIADKTNPSYNFDVTTGQNLSIKLENF